MAGGDAEATTLEVFPLRRNGDQVELQVTVAVPEDGEDDPVGRQRNRRVEIRFATDGPVDLVAPDVPGELPDPATAPTEESG